MSPDTELASAEPGQRVDAVYGPVTPAQLVRYAGASGDYNPIHYNHFYAVEAKLGGVVAHGMLTMAFMGRALTDRMGPSGRVVRIAARFTSLVRPGDAIAVTIGVTARRTTATTTEVDCDLVARVGDRDVAGGSATLAWPLGNGRFDGSRG
ncbi:MaoC/PaaZ C-terminal domain-containing protein [uncultured Enterovirga sp.]|uniref:MaoC/PaaZ C-terminal domain-containing protein n=1 Tax=uncultured Enterovirga sp. TaxID=2026352 RepID=UPI0035C9F8E2